jgi:hypothetical protein
MNERKMRSFAAWARTVGAVAALIFVGRFAFVAIRAALAKTATPTEAASSSHPPRGMDRPPRHGVPRDEASSASSSDPVVVATSGTAIRVTAMITAGPDRSEVFIDGADVGKTPYVGDASCRLGETVHVRIIPSHGLPLDFDRICNKGSLKVEP